jgi:hypothetical protein
MEAQGHEEIERYLSEFMADALKTLSKDKEYKGCRNVLQNKKADDISRAMYMGNWLTDNSQLFAPDFFFDFQYNLPKHLQGAEDILLMVQGKLNSLSSKEDKHTIFGELNDILKTSIDYTRQIKKNRSDKKPKPAEFKYATKDAWWEVAQSIIKLLGYRKFCMTNYKPVRDEAYMAIVSSFIDQNTQDASKYQFKLNQYYPNDHLDRHFDPTHLKTERLKQRSADIWLKQQPQPSNNKEKEQLETDYENRGSLRRNCFDDREISSSQYGYLHHYVNILGLKLNYLNKELIMPYFVKGNKLPTGNQFLVLCAQLGHSLHGVEDFFAHSNYLELIVQNLDTLKGQMGANSDKYFSKDEFIDIIKNSSTYEKDRFDRATNKAIRDITLLNPKPIDEEILTTGIFAEVDTFASLYHLTFGMLEEEIENLKSSNVTDDPAMAVLQYIIVSLTDYIKLLENWPADINVKYKIAKGIKKKFNTDILWFILNRNPEFKKTKTRRDERFEKYLEYIADMLNALYQALAPLLIAKDGAVMVLKFIQVMLMLCFLPIMLLYFFKRITMGGITGIALSEGLLYVFNELANYVEKQKLKLNSVKMYGTHSVLAKDDSYRNVVMNRQAKRMALFMDEFILLTMLLGCNPTTQEQTNMVTLLRKYLKHPCPDNSRTKEELQKELALYGTNSYIYVKDTITKKTVPLSFQGIYNSGLVGKVKGITGNEYKEKFFEYNGEIIKEEYLTISNLTIDKIILPKEITFDTIILPFQTEERIYRFANNTRILHKQIKEVVITGGTTINPNKMWKMQFFNKEDYSLLFNKSLIDKLLEYIELKNPTERIDDVFLEKDKLVFGSDKATVSLIDNTPKIKLEDVIGTFSNEEGMKKEYERFIEEFIKIHYK